MKRIGLRVNNDKVKKQHVTEIAEWLKSNGIEPVMVNGDDTIKDLEMLVIMGGDGTLLGAARRASKAGVPLLGIDFGGLGFLSEVKFENAQKALSDILKGKYHIEERVMLEAVVSRGGKTDQAHPCVNDVVITKKSGRMLRLKVYINDEYFTEFPGDGLIISTATGSTAYSLSAGGPIVSPGLNVLLLTAICPHTLFARSHVTSADDDILVQLPAKREDLIMTIDGQDEYTVEAGGEVLVRKADYPVKYIRIRPPRFLATLRDKFNLD